MKNILVVDDEFDLTGTLRAILEAAGYRAETCHNGKQALAHLQQEQKPDLVLMDIMMPLMSGLDVLREMHNTGLGKIPVILMTSAPPRVSSEELPWRALLRKPFTMQMLLKTVEDILRPDRPKL